jgi:hypothetical protein
MATFFRGKGQILWDVTEDTAYVILCTSLLQD